MDFIKKFSMRTNAIGDGYALIEDGHLTLRIKNKEDISYKIKEAGVIDKGLGCVVEIKKEHSPTPFTQLKLTLNKEDIPANLQAPTYKFRIPSTKISDTEYTFLFKNARTI